MNHGKLIKIGLAAVFALSMATGTTPALAQKKGGTLIMVVQPEPPSLAPYISTAQPIGQIATKVYDGLLEYDIESKAQPALAESWSVSEDGRSITFKLRQDVSWHDGKPFTSADVQFTFMEVLSKFHPRGINVMKTLTAVDTPDDYTAVFRLSEPAPYLLRVLSGYESPIVPKHAFGTQDVRSYAYSDKPIGTGPFKFTEWKRGQYVRLDRNPSYWRKGLPYLDRIVARFIPDAGTRTAAIETGEVGMVALNHIAPQSLPALRKVPEIAVETGGYGMLPSVTMLIFNTTRPPFDKQAARQAVSYAIDRQFIIDTAFYGIGSPATGPMHSSVPFYTNEVRRYDVADRIAIANKLLDDAGMARGKDGYRFEVFVDPQPFGETYQRMAEVVVQQLDAIGIRVSIRYEDTPRWLKRVYTDYEFDMAATGYFNFADPVIGVHRGYHSNQIKKGTVFVNAGQWSSPKTDQLMDEATVENDDSRRAELYRALQQELVEAAPMVWLFESEYYTVHRRQVKDIANSALGPFHSMDKAWIDD